jgi:Protein of unknown function (DUF1778)
MHDCMGGARRQKRFIAGRPCAWPSGQYKLEELLRRLIVPLLLVAKRDHIPSRRTGKSPLGAKVFSYFTQEERRLVEKAAKLERRSLSSFVALAAIERAQRIVAGQ